MKFEIPLTFEIAVDRFIDKRPFEDIVQLLSKSNIQFYLEFSRGSVSK